MGVGVGCGWVVGGGYNMADLESSQDVVVC